MSGRLPIDKVKVGDKITEPVINSFGQTIVPARTVLNNKHIKLFKMWNIKSVTIEQDGDDRSEADIEFSDEVLLLAKKRLDKRLKWEPENDFEQDLYLLGIINAANKIVKSQ